MTAPSVTSTIGRQDLRSERFESDGSSFVEGVASTWSTRIARTVDGVVVTVRGHVDRDGSRLLSQLIADLVVGQGNLAVVVNMQDVVAEEAPEATCADSACGARGKGARFTIRSSTAYRDGGP